MACRIVDMHRHERQGHDQRFLDKVQRPQLVLFEFPDLECVVGNTRRCIVRKQQSQFCGQRQLKRFQTTLTDRIDRYCDLALQHWPGALGPGATLRIREAERHLPGNRRVAPVRRHSSSIQRLEITFDNRCQTREVFEFFLKFNNLTASRQLRRRATISQQIAHGARMISTSRATVKDPDRENVGSGRQTE